MDGERSLFSLHNVPAQLAMLWSEITANWNEFRVANLFGTGTYIVPAFICPGSPWLGVCPGETDLR